MTKAIDAFDQYYAKDRKAWRKWLLQNHNSSPGVWLIYYKKDSGKSRVPYDDAVEEALCFGWIDSTLRPGDEHYYMQLFMPRKEKSGWSKLNKERIIKLTANGLMTSAGLKAIDIAKENGSWNKLDKIESHELPPEMEKAFKNSKAARKYFDTLGPSTRKYMIYWITNAKLPETRAKRLAELIPALAEGKKPAHFLRPAKK
jgi:uncharacterized protein YdeI (YjbR/CyaY-like superfamily)